MDWALFSTMRAEDRDALLALAQPRRFGRNEVICHAGDPADSLHLVEAGHLAVRGTLPSGYTASFAILGPGDYFGELALLRADHRRTATVVALEPSRTLAIAGSAIHRALAGDARIATMLATLLADRVDRLSSQLLETMYVGLDRRVFRRLVWLANSYGVVDNRADLPISQAQLADLVGATRPSVNQVLQKIARQGLVEMTRGRIRLLDVAELTRRGAA